MWLNQVYQHNAHCYIIFKLNVNFTSSIAYNNTNNNNNNTIIVKTEQYDLPQLCILFWSLMYRLSFSVSVVNITVSVCHNCGVSITALNEYWLIDCSTSWWGEWHKQVRSTLGCVLSVHQHAAGERRLQACQQWLFGMMQWLLNFRQGLLWLWLTWWMVWTAVAVGWTAVTPRVACWNRGSGWAWGRAGWWCHPSSAIGV